MKILRRIVGLFLVAVLLLSFPLTSFAAPAAVPAVSDYIFDTLLAANGIDTSFAGVSSWLGSWTGYDDYLEQGKQGKLGAYSQWLYDIQHNAEAEEMRVKARAQIDEMTGWMNMDWDDVGGKDVTLGTGILNGWVNGVKGTAADYGTSIKGYLGSFASYGSDALDYIKEIASVNDSIEGWAKPSTFGKCFLSYSEPGYFSYEVDYKWLFLPANFNEANTPYAYLESYNSSRGKYYVKFKYLSNVAPTIGKNYGLHLYVHSQTLDTKTNKVRMNDSSVSTNDGRYLTAAQVKSIPFPVFSSKAAADSFVANKAMENLINQEAFGLPVISVNKDAQTLEPKVVPTVITLPQTGEKAAELMDALSDAMDRIDALEVALKNAGLALRWGDVVLPTSAPTDAPIDIPDTETKTTLAAILAKVEAIPATIEAIFKRKIEPEDSEKDVENMKLPKSLVDKFPFCIPFDVAYLVNSMNASSEVPRFELPFRIHYLSYNYEHTFVVDMSDWDAAVKILRTMLDLLFIAGLMSATRELIRG